MYPSNILVEEPPATERAGFNLVPHVNTFNSVFDTKPLDPIEEFNLKTLLIGSSIEDNDERIQTDFEGLTRITAEIKAIDKQATVLLGERVFRAREILKPYKDGTFTRWLESTFGTKKTGYNVLSYYDLYTALPSDHLRDCMKKLPHKTAYILASRDGDIQAKFDIISEHYDKPHKTLVTLIKERLPNKPGDKRSAKISISRLLAGMHDSVEKLKKNKKLLTDSDRKHIIDIQKSLEKIINV